MQCGVERSLVDLQDVARDLLNALRDAPTVHGLEREGLEDEHVERPLQDVGVVGRHPRLSCRASTGGWSGLPDASRAVEAARRRTATAYFVPGWVTPDVEIPGRLAKRERHPGVCLFSTQWR